MTKELEQQVLEKEAVVRAEIEADLFRQAETERELEASHRAAEQVESAKIEAAKEYKKDIQRQVEEKEREKEFAYQQAPLLYHITYMSHIIWAPVVYIIISIH